MVLEHSELDKSKSIDDINETTKISKKKSKSNDKVRKASAILKAKANDKSKKPEAREEAANSDSDEEVYDDEPEGKEVPSKVEDDKLDDDGDCVMISEKGTNITINPRIKTVTEKYYEAAKGAKSWIKLTGNRNFVQWWSKSSSIMNNIGCANILEKIINSHTTNNHLNLNREQNEVIKDYLATTVNIKGLAIGSGDAQDNLTGILRKNGMIRSYKEQADIETNFKIDIRKSRSENLATWEMIKLSMKLSHYTIDEYLICKMMEANMEQSERINLATYEMKKWTAKNKSNANVSEAIEEFHNHKQILVDQDDPIASPLLQQSPNPEEGNKVANINASSSEKTSNGRRNRQDGGARPKKQRRTPVACNFCGGNQPVKGCPNKKKKGLGMR